MSSITIRGCCIGAGRPKVILPIVARTEDDILREARRLSALKADCIEWRADWFSDVLVSAARSVSAAVPICLTSSSSRIEKDFRPSSGRRTRPVSQWFVPAMISTKRRPGRRWSHA